MHPSSVAFGRLCVETALMVISSGSLPVRSPSGGCVLKQNRQFQAVFLRLSVAFGRLCVETMMALAKWVLPLLGRLRAAVC